MMLSCASSQLDLQCLRSLLVGFERKADVQLTMEPIGISFVGSRRKNVLFTILFHYASPILIEALLQLTDINMKYCIDQSFFISVFRLVKPVKA